MTSTSPTISVLMSVYNGGRYLAEAIESILTQTFTDFEFLILDDGSTEDVLSILREYELKDPRVKVRSRPNKGLTRSLNELFAWSSGDFLARMDSDDVALPDRFAHQVEALRRDPSLVCVGGNFQLIDGEGRVLTTLQPPPDHAEIQRRALAGHGTICHPTAMIRRDALTRLKGYDESFKTAQDLDLWLRLGEIGRLANLPETVLKFRLHEGSVSETKRVEQRTSARIACERAWARRGIRGVFEAEAPWRPGSDAASRFRFALQYGWWAFNSRQRRTALHYGVQAIKARPFQPDGWKLLVAAAVKPMRRAVIQALHGDAPRPRPERPLPQKLPLSIIVPMRNGRPFVEKSIRSLFAQMPGPYEIVVVDDGSTDGSPQLVSLLAEAPDAPIIRVVLGPRQGISAALNAGIAAAVGSLICRCDADDLFPPGRLARQVDWLNEHPDFGAVCGSFSTITHKGAPIADLECGRNQEEITEELRQGRSRTHLGTWLIRADAIRAAGGFRPWFITAEDIDLQLRVGGVCQVFYEPISSYIYRLHDASITHTQATNAREFYEATAKAFARQRQAGGRDDLDLGNPPAPPGPDQTAESRASGAHLQVQGMLVGASWKEHRAGHKMKALATGFRACLARPQNFKAWKNLGALAVKSPGRAA